MFTQLDVKTSVNGITVPWLCRLSIFTSRSFWFSTALVFIVACWLATSASAQAPAGTRNEARTDLKFVSPGKPDSTGIDTKLSDSPRSGVELKILDPISEEAKKKPLPPKNADKASRSAPQKPVTESEKVTPPEPAAATPPAPKKGSLLDRLNAAAKLPPKDSTQPEAAPASKYDPVKENGVFFEGWEKPKVAIMLTGLLDGYIEPCGCAGMDRMKGGLSRRLSLVNELRERAWNLFVVDAGQIASGFGVQEELKFDMVMNAMRLMKCNAIGIGKSELRFPAHFLLTFTAPPSMSEQSRFVSANVALYSFHELYTLPFKVLEQSGAKIGVTSVIFPSNDLSHRDENILIEDPRSKLREILPKLEEKKCDHHILIVHGTEAETIAIAKEFPIFNIVLCSDSPSAPPAQPTEIANGQYLIEVGEKGKYAIVLGFYDDEKMPMRYQRVAIDSRYEQSKDIFLLMEGYQKILKTLIETKGYRNGLGLSLAESPQRALLGDYVGSSQCESCHEESYRVWRKNRHSTAWQSLTKTASPPRDFDPECISCHVVGWHGIENFPYQGGFETGKSTPILTNVGCESCHGPGSKHIEAEQGTSTQLQESIRAAMRLGNNTRKVCFSCHDGDNSPAFDFDTYYPKIEHKEK